MLGGGGGEYFTFLGSFCAATHIIDKACSIAVKKKKNKSVALRGREKHISCALFIN